MVNDIIDGVVAALIHAFPGHEVYTEHVEQGINPPCFSVSPVEFTSIPYLGTRALRTASININYYPSGEEPKQECLKMGDALITALEYITVGGDIVRGSNMSYRTVDGVLVFTLDYNVFVRRPIEGDTIDSYTMKKTARGG